jgi:hypothetical protein
VSLTLQYYGKKRCNTLKDKWLPVTGYLVPVNTTVQPVTGSPAIDFSGNW